MNSEKPIEKIMDYRQFQKIFDKAIFQTSKKDLIERIANNPERYVGLFRPTTPRAKIIQNLLQSHEIRFGDAFENLITAYLEQSGFSILDKKFTAKDGNILELDQVFSNDDCVFFVEQKIRDDHDSTKKRGQADNFKKKIEVILEKHIGSQVKGFFYFIDDSFRKNRNFYKEKIEEFSAMYKITLYLSYGQGFFSEIGISNVWDEICDHLILWKKHIPDVPDINFDDNPEESFHEIKDLNPKIYMKLFSNNELSALLDVLFPKGKTLSLLSVYFEEKYQSCGKIIYNELKNLCRKEN